MNDKIEAGGFSVEFVLPPVAKVELILQPIGAVPGLATIVRGYKQVYAWDPPTEAEQERLLQDINRTKLHTPLEMLSYTWLVRDVTRAFTHQMVRTRVGAAYVQESMRFSDKRQAKVLVPPAIAADAGRLGAYRETVGDAFQAYARMIGEGVPIQDARGVLPHNVLTHLFVSYTLSTLAKTASLRYCCQAQAMTADGEGEWRTVLEQMKATLPVPLRRFVAAPWETGEVSCGFEASFDRPCRFTEKFTPNFEALKAKRDAAAKAARSKPLPGQLSLPGVDAAQSSAPVQAPVQEPSPRMGLDLNQPMGHGAKAQPIPEPERRYTKLYNRGDFRAFAFGEVLHVVLRTGHLWRTGGTGLAVKLFWSILAQAEGVGATIIHVHERDRQLVYILSLEDFWRLGVEVPGNDMYGPSSWVTLDHWKALSDVAYMEEMAYESLSV